MNKAVVGQTLQYFSVLIPCDEEPETVLICHYFHRQWVISERNRDDFQSSLFFEFVPRQLPYEPLLLCTVAWGQDGQIAHNVFKAAW